MWEIWDKYQTSFNVMIYVQYKSQNSAKFKTLVIQSVQFFYTNNINSIDNFCINNCFWKILQNQTMQNKTKQREKKNTITWKALFYFFFQTGFHVVTQNVILYDNILPFCISACCPFSTNKNLNKQKLMWLKVAVQHTVAWG